jgi:FkbM family methyltransferase
MLSRKGISFRDKKIAFLLAGLPQIGLYRKKVRSKWIQQLNSYCHEGQLIIRIRINNKPVIFSMRKANVADYIVGGELVAQVYKPPRSFYARQIIDGGANIGMFTVLAAAYFPEASIVSYEPDPGNFQQLERNVKLNRIRARVVQKGLWSETKTLFFHAGSSEVGYVDEHPPGIEIQCEAPVVQESSWVKLDIEGAEYEVLPAIMKQEVKPLHLSMELHHMLLKGPLLLDLLRMNGYRLAGDIESPADCYVIEAGLN